jgi:hypothetical protein
MSEDVDQSGLNKQTSDNARSEKIMPVAVAIAFFVLALAFWWLNGPAVFSDLVVSAWALCF